MKNSCVATFTRVLAGLAAFTLLGCNESGVVAPKRAREEPIRTAAAP